MVSIEENLACHTRTRTLYALVLACEEVVRCRGHSLTNSGMGSAVGASEVTVCVSFFWPSG